ncbi:DDE-type integrase/transposase/recombinase [Streptomyces fagopyri]|uniref:DDE-type integrase/transposase/recombinase n=1 Tax=Streptomyces fagopyri TaxID=2662397 RepID=UPI00340443F0
MSQLRETSGAAVNPKRVARIMRAPEIEEATSRRRYRTTVPDPAASKAQDLIGRDFTAGEPNTKYVGDITYQPIGGGKFCCPATVIDLASRRRAGRAITDPMRADLVTDALASEIRTRGSLAGSIMHTDHGAQYTSRAFVEACRSAGVRRSMSAGGFSADIALAEFFNATFKCATLQGRKSRPTEGKARLDASRRFHRYNPPRRNSRLGRRSPIAFENAVRLTPTTPAQAASSVSGSRPVRALDVGLLEMSRWRRVLEHLECLGQLQGFPAVQPSSSTARITCRALCAIAGFVFR